MSRAATEALFASTGGLLIGWAAAANDAWYQLHLLTYYCATNPGTLARAHVFRAVVAVVGVVLVLVIRPRAGSLAARHALSEAALFYLKVAVAVGLAFVVTDRILRWKRAAAPPAPPGAPLTVDAAQLRPKKEATIATLDGRMVSYAFNEEGLRTRSASDVLDHKAPTILFNGESVMLGFGIDYDDTISARVGANLGIQTANLAMSGVATDQSFVRLEQYLPRFEHPAAVVTLVAFNVLFRNFAEWRSHLVLDETGKLVLVPAKVGLLDDSPLYQTFQSIYHSSDAVTMARAVLRDTDALVKRSGARPLFLFTQCASERCVSTGPSGPWIREYLREGLGLESIDVEFDPKMTQYADFHPTARALDAYVSAITDALRRLGVGQ